MSTSTQPGTSLPPPSPAIDEAMKIICAKNFHQRIWLPANELHEKLRVTFGTTTNFSDNTLPVILFCPPMFGGRWLCVHVDHLARQTGVRVVCADRPGMGGSTPVPLNIRIKVWLETVSALLQHLNVSHVSVVCHSAGTIYALNTLYHFRDFLDPQAPYVGLLAPWVDNVYSRTTLMNLATKVPTGMVDNLSSIIKFVNKRIVPVTSWSGGIVSSSMGLFQTEGGNVDADATSPAEKYGVDEEIAKSIETLCTKFFFEEDVTAGNEEAKLCLKKAGPGLWGSCEDFSKYAKLVNDKEQQRLNSESATDLKVKLRLQVYFAESDAMIGSDGQKYFNTCWREAESAIDFKTTELPGTNHETILADRKKGALPLIFEQVGKLHIQ